MIDIIFSAFKKDPTVKRHLLKTVSWRIVGSADTVVLGWLITGQPSLGFAIGGAELFTKMILYFIHERLWHRSRFGRQSRHAHAQQVREENAGKLFAQTGKIDRALREQLNEHAAFTVWLTGLPASGKSTIANELDSWMHKHGVRSYVVDGDNTRLGLNSDLSFTREDRAENIRRVAELCRLFNDAGIIAIASFISPFAADRENAKNIIGAEDFIEVFTDASINTCRQRDRKGLYKLAEEGKIKDFTGISSPYEKPLTPDIHLHSDAESPGSCVNRIINFLSLHKLLVLSEGTVG